MFGPKVSFHLRAKVVGSALVMDLAVGRYNWVMQYNGPMLGVFKDQECCILEELSDLFYFERELK